MPRFRKLQILILSVVLLGISKNSEASKSLKPSKTSITEPAKVVTPEQEDKTSEEHSESEATSRAEPSAQAETESATPRVTDPHLLPEEELPAKIIVSGSKRVQETPIELKTPKTEVTEMPIAPVETAPAETAPAPQPGPASNTVSGSDEQRTTEVPGADAPPAESSEPVFVEGQASENTDAESPTKSVKPAHKKKTSQSPPNETAATPPAPVPAAAAAAKPAKLAPEAQTSLHWLENGNSRYVKKRFRADGRTEKDRARITKEQKPHAIVLACSDSRVPPELVFDQALGEIYVIRVLGEALTDTVMANIEHAVKSFNPHLLVVLGHTQCEAVDEALKAPDQLHDLTPGMEQILNEIRPHLKTVQDEPRTSSLDVEATLNADGVGRDLAKRSSLIREKVESGELLIKPALYHLDSGKVGFY